MLHICLVFWESEPQYAYKRYAYKKNECLTFLQCAKLLGDVSVMQFYPSKFVLVTDILDNFGEY